MSIGGHRGSARPLAPPSGRPGRSAAASVDEHVDAHAPLGQVDTGVVVGVAEALDIEQADRRRGHRERTPVPGPRRQHQGLERLEQEGPDRPPTSSGSDSSAARGHDDDGGDVERHQHLGVGLVAEEHLAAQPAGHLGHLGPGVADDVDVGVAPGVLSRSRPSSGSVSRRGSQPKGRQVSSAQRHRADLTRHGTRSSCAHPVSLVRRIPPAGSEADLTSGCTESTKRGADHGRAQHRGRRADRRTQRHGAGVVDGQVPRVQGDHRRAGSSNWSTSSRWPGAGYVEPHSHPTHEFYYVLRGRGIMTIDGEDRDDRPGRPRLHPARQGPHPAPGQRPRPHPLLLLRHRREGRRAHRLHQPLGGTGPRHPPSPGGLASTPSSTAGHEIVQEARRPAALAGELTAAATEVDGIVCLLTDRIDAAVLEAGAAGRLRVVANVAVGYDNIDVARPPDASGVAVCNTPGVLDQTTADLALLLILAASRQWPRRPRPTSAAGRWRGWGISTISAATSTAPLLGLVGYGRIARARWPGGPRRFGMEVCHHTRHNTGFPGYHGLARRPARPGRHASASTCPCPPSTHHLIGAAELALMKPTAVLVNTARGPVVDEQALADALESGTIYAAGLDVYEDEPTVTRGCLRRRARCCSPTSAAPPSRPGPGWPAWPARGWPTCSAGDRPTNLVDAPPGV